MTTLTIRNIDDDLKSQLQTRAEEHGRSLEEEAEVILRSALENQVPEKGLGTWIHQQFAALGGVELDIPARTEIPRFVDFDE